METKAYREATTTPTPKLAPRAVGMQMIINWELGLNFCGHRWQGRFIVDEVSDQVEDAVCREFERFAERGGLLVAMDTMHQRAWQPF